MVDEKANSGDDLSNHGDQKRGDKEMELNVKGEIENSISTILLYILFI